MCVRAGVRCVRALRVCVCLEVGGGPWSRVIPASAGVAESRAPERRLIAEPVKKGRTMCSVVCAVVWPQLRQVWGAAA